MTRRTLALWVGAAALGWGLLLLRPAARNGADQAGAAAPAASSAAAGRKPWRAAEEPTASTDRARPSEPDAPVDGAEAVDAQARARRERLALEGNRRHDRRFDAAVARWKEEQQRKRQEPWASRRELALRSALARDGLVRLAQRIECRATLCRLQLAIADPRSARELRRASHFMREVGSETASALAGEGDEGTMILFAARPGVPLGMPLASPHP